MQPTDPSPIRSRVLTTSRLAAQAKCTRADYLRCEDELRPVGVELEPEHLTRGSVVHAGLAAAVSRFPAEPDERAVAVACAAEAVERGLGATDPRIVGWARLALRAARAMRPGDWRPVSSPVRPVAKFSGSGRGEGAVEVRDSATGRLRSDAGQVPDGSADADGGVGPHESGETLAGTTGAPPPWTCPDCGGAGEHVLGRRGGTQTCDTCDGTGAVLVEQRLGVSLPDLEGVGDDGHGWLYSFKPDAVLWNLRTRRRWQWDHKTKGKGTMSRVTPWTELHMQSLLYVYGLRTLGVDVDGAVLYAVLAEEPSVPKLRADGHVGRVGQVATDWPTACEVIARSADPDPESPRYAELRRRCDEREWQVAQEVRFDDAELESAWSHLVDSRDELVRDLRRARERAAALRVPVWKAMHPTGRGVHCEQCEYRAWCAEDFAGRDPEALIGSSYRRGKDKYLAEVALTSTRGDTGYRTPDDFDAIDRRRSAP